MSVSLSYLAAMSASARRSPVTAWMSRGRALFTKDAGGALIATINQTPDDLAAKQYTDPTDAGEEAAIVVMMGVSMASAQETVADTWAGYDFGGLVSNDGDLLPDT